MRACANVVRPRWANMSRALRQRCAVEGGPPTVASQIEALIVLNTYYGMARRLPCIK